jgi:hypothetical protein
MIIEQQSDRNMTGMDLKKRNVSDMIDLQRALVADHIAGLQREGAALRAERARDGRAATSALGSMTVPVRLPVSRPSRRVRLGRWLVGVGAAIAGPTETAALPGVAASDATGSEDAGNLSHAA